MKKQTLSVPVQVRFSPDQIKAVRAAAKIARVPYTTFIREAAEERVRGEDPLARERFARQAAERRLGELISRHCACRHQGCNGGPCLLEP